MRDSVLNDQRLNSLGMRQDHSKSDRHAVVLHVEVVLCDADGFDEVIHDFSDVVEGVREFLWIGPIAVAEARIVRRNEMKAIGQARKERLKHARRRRETV